MNLKINLLCMTLFASAIAPAWALTSDKSQPIQIEADKGELDKNNQTTEFSGNVIIRQGSLFIQAGSVRVVKAASGAQTIRATGSPVKFGQDLDRQGNVRGQANLVEYQSATGVVRLTGNARLQRGGDTASGGVITYNTRTEVYTVNGGSRSNGAGGRVRITIQPQK